jgi:hypothetical protein
MRAVRPENSAAPQVAEQRTLKGAAEAAAVVQDGLAWQSLLHTGHPIISYGQVYHVAFLALLGALPAFSSGLSCFHRAETKRPS